MRIHQRAILVVIAIVLIPLVSGITRAQYAEGLPPGVLGIEVDGQPLDLVTIPVTDDATPEISGRLDTGVATIELAIADGEVIRFPAEVDNRGRFRATVPQPLPDGQYSLYLGDVLVGSFSVSGAAAATGDRQPGPLLDIARVVPYPVDFGEAIPGIGFLDGRFYTLEEEAVRTAAAAASESSPDARVTERRLAEAGWLQRYENRLASPNPEDPTTFSAQVSSFVVEYASGADAKSALATLVGEDPAIEFPTVGEESVLTLLTGVTPDTGSEYQAARLVFRIGPMLGMIVYADLLGQEPDLTLLGTVAQAVAARGDVIAQRQTLPLGSMTLRLDPEASVGRITRRDIYDVRGGDLTPLYNQDQDAQVSRVELFSGTTDAFASTTSGTLTDDGRTRAERRASTPTATDPAASDQSAAPSPTSVISIEGQDAADVAPTASPAETTPDASGTPAGEAPATAQVTMSTALYEFAGDGEAEAWLTAQRDRLAAGTPAEEATIVELIEGAAFGDASATYSTRRPGGENGDVAIGYQIFARVSGIVAVLDIESIPEIPLNGAENLMEQQLACIEAQGCMGPATLPASLFGGRDRTREGDVLSSSPATPETEAAAETPSSVITIEGEDAPPGATTTPREDGEPRPDRPRRRDRENTEDEAPPADAAG